MTTDKRIDAYIARSQDFAKPILEYLRVQVHKACPQVTETIKWGMPYFQYQGALLCGMASFKQHCAFGFWKSSLMKDPGKIFKNEENAGMGNFGRIQTVKDLPPARTLAAYIKEAMQLHGDGTMKASKEISRPALPVPGYFQKALNKNKTARSVFDKLAPSHKKEYIKWLEEAKTETTRNRRMETALEWIAEGKGRHWKIISTHF